MHAAARLLKTSLAGSSNELASLVLYGTDDPPCGNTASFDVHGMSASDLVAHHLCGASLMRRILCAFAPMRILFYQSIFPVFPLSPWERDDRQLGNITVDNHVLVRGV